MFIKTTFLNLPDINSVLRWLMGIDGKPGLLKASFDFLLSKSLDDSYRDCALIVDGMKIRSHQDVDNQGEYVGFIDYGQAYRGNDSEVLATEALVFMAVGLKGHWKLPVAYFLINGISATEQAELILTTMESLYVDCSVRVRSLTLDGHATNISTLRKLGCDLHPEELVVQFPHPSQLWQIHCFLDPCHCLKLVRNQFCDLKEIHMEDRGVARWSHIEKLNTFQKKEGLTAANKLTDRHVHFEHQKMKVCISYCVLNE